MKKIDEITARLLDCSVVMDVADLGPRRGVKYIFVYNPSTGNKNIRVYGYEPSGQVRPRESAIRMSRESAARSGSFVDLTTDYDQDYDAAARSKTF